MNFKNLLLGSAASLLAASAVQAADMPAVEPIEYVRVCDAFGTGFYYIPGTDTCLKLSGYVRTEWRWRADQDDDAAHTPQDAPNGYAVYDDGSSHGPATFVDESFTSAAEDNFSTFARGALSIDARRMTDAGLLRAAFAYFVNVDQQFDASENNPDTSNVDFAFIQLSNDMGTLTAGHTGSFFNFKGSGTLEGVGANDPNVNLIGYSFNVGNGASFSIAIEDSNSGGRNGGFAIGNTAYSSIGGYSLSCTDTFAEVYDTDAGTDWDYEVCAADHGGDHVPDLAGNIRLDQAWGTVQIMGALHEVRAVLTGGDWQANSGTEAEIELEDIVSESFEEWGWAVGAGAEFNSGALSAYIQGFYGEGVGNYFWSPVSGATTYEGYIVAPDGKLELGEAFFVNGNITADIGSGVTAKVSASYGDWDAPSGFANWDEWAVAGDLLWNPVGGLTIGVGLVHWDNSDFGDGTKGRLRFQSSF